MGVGWDEERPMDVQERPGVGSGDMDQATFAGLVDEYQKQVYALAYRYLRSALDAEDATQETFLRAFANLESYHPQRSFRSWLLSITVHLCIDRLRRERRRLYEPLQPYHLVSGGDSLDARLMSWEDRGEIRRLIDQLPPHYRQLALLRYWDDLTYQEIGRRMGLSTGAVKSRLHRARRQLVELAESDAVPLALTPPLPRPSRSGM